MNVRFNFAVFVLVVVLLAMPKARASAPQPGDFRDFFSEFAAAVKANDPHKIADLMVFPVKDWSVERKGNVETIGIKDRAEFLRKYDSLFTASMRAHVIKGKPQKIGSDHYALIWDDADAEFSFEFEHSGRVGFRLTAFGIGPR